MTGCFYSLPVADVCYYTFATGKLARNKDNLFLYIQNRSINIMTKKLEIEDRVIITKKDGKAKIFTWSQLMNGTGEIEWLVEGLFSAGSVVTVSGKPGSKKTWTLLDYVVCQANYENEWLGFKIKQHVPVLIVDEESGSKRLSMRLKEIVKGHNVKNKLDITATCISGFNFRDKNDLMELSDLIRQTSAKIIVIDTLMDVLAGGDDNASKDISPMYKGLRKLADHFKALIIVIHHNSKGGGYRGSTAIEGSSDLMIQVTSKQDSPNIDFEITKKRDDITRTKWAAYIYSTDKSFILRKSGKSLSKVGKVQEHIVRYLMDYDTASIDDLQSNNGGHAVSSIKGAVYKLIELDLVIQNGYDGKKKLYSLTPDGKMYTETYLSTEIIIPIFEDKKKSNKRK
jgi:archaellum biogenesis ATPase FlaH